ncbi:hybrid sensor histidine kinase/response regulator [Gimesia fumaroli]|jgi:two-component system chemotaxis sensor kinase CheA|uniref:histidine kinase n=1 Tax=Gimesia fumaroli TaxID=2527976 RepID=A0A518IBX9_9PLAN|nr:chemotaxis protein CheW [Gimesia fumaroli]QDV50601.1 Chemotaxis protein CheA [Gimesia fumaroli]
MDDILQEFLAESWENLGQLDSEIVELEKDPQNAELIASIFRTIHTIKGTCGFLGLTNLGAVAHSAENVLGKMREGLLDVSPGAISLVLEAIDKIKELLQGLEATGEEPKTDHSTLTSMLDDLAEFATNGGGDASAGESAPAENATPAEAVADSNPPTESSEAQAEPVAASPETTPEVKPEAPAEPAVPASVAEDPAAKSSKVSVADLSIRVNVNVVDSLMNLVGELVLTRNQLLQLARGDEESKYAAPITHLNRVTTDLQEGVMKTRMQPIGNAWNKLPRLVRDLSQVTNKHIELIMTGAETELDRTVLDAIKDPLTHMVRNSADHGIETPDIRKANGKPESGTIHLNAYHEGGHVIIEIQDDGAGISRERVLKKAIAQGLIKEADAANVADSHVFSMIFQAGFSTAEQVSSISGRGVGMDVVRTQIEKIGGTVDLSSKMGKGTMVRIKIPLTLAIVSALVLESGEQPFAIPQLGVVELVRLSAEDRKKIETIHDKKVFRLRDRLLPLVHLNEVLGLEEKAPEDDDLHDTNIVVVQVGEDQFGLIVSRIFDTEEIVVKPVGRLLKNIGLYQGTTILGDGRVVMILDVGGIFNQCGGSSAHSQTVADEATSGANRDTISMLLFGAGEGETMAVPLSLVARLEEFPLDSIELNSGRQVVQYRENLLPLLSVEGVGYGGGEQIDPQPVIVFSENNRSMGLMVNEIKDIIDEQLVIRMQSDRPGVLGTAIIGKNAIDVIDTQYYVTRSTPNWFDKVEDKKSFRVLVVDDSMFFRQLVATALETEGFSVVTSDSCVTAVEILEKDSHFQAVVTDVDLPMMDGFEFCEWLKTNDSLKELCAIALTASNNSANQAKASEVGFDQFLTKFNSQELVSCLDEYFARLKLNAGVNA